MPIARPGADSPRAIATVERQTDRSEALATRLAESMERGARTLERFAPSRPSGTGLPDDLARAGSDLSIACVTTVGGALPGGLTVHTGQPSYSTLLEGE